MPLKMKTMKKRQASAMKFLKENDSRHCTSFNNNNLILQKV